MAREIEFDQYDFQQKHLKVDKAFKFETFNEISSLNTLGKKNKMPAKKKQIYFLSKHIYELHFRPIWCF